MLKSISARIWAAYAALLFLTTMIIAFPFFLLCFLYEEPSRSRKSYPIYRLWMKVFLPMIGIRVKVHGLENFDRGNNYVVVCNHNSFIDIPISSTKVPGPNKTIAKIEMSRIPVFGTLYKLGSVLVDRKNKDSRRKSIIQMKKVLDMGIHMIIYPEGTRNKSSEPLLPFHNGAFSLAIDTGKEIIPAIITGTKKIMPPDKFAWLLPGQIEMHVLTPVKPEGDVESLKEKVFGMMRGRVVEV